MVVQHNMQAMNANRMMGATQTALSKSTEKLSSGYKINRAADDAAGLSISEKMRKQIRGLDQASSNAEDGISAVQTAEGALTEVHDMLQRMNELAVQAANGTNSDSDRQSIQDEISQLTTEIDRVSETTKFNETYLLKGDSASTASAHNVSLHDAGITGVTLGTVGTDGYATISFGSNFTTDGKITIAGKEYTIDADKSDTTNKTVSAIQALTTINTAQAETLATYEVLTASSIGTDVAAKAYCGSADTAAASLSTDNVATKIKVGTVNYKSALSFNLHVGADADSTNKIGVSINTMNSAYLGIKGMNIKDSTGMAATYAIDAISDAVSKVSSQRSALGAIQNRLEHTVNNLDNVVENTTSAESRIRDTDMAEEMVNYSKNNILASAGQSMLAQANSSNQGVLSLLQ